MLIPLRIKAYDPDGGHGEAERLILLDRAAMAVPLGPYRGRPMLSINRGFSAPVIVDFAREDGELAWLAAHDDDPFARYEALQPLSSEAPPSELPSHMPTSYAALILKTKTYTYLNNN